MTNFNTNRIDDRNADRDLVTDAINDFLSNGGSITRCSTRRVANSKTFEKRHRPNKHYARGF